jgi:hypothetical protein
LCGLPTKYKMNIYIYIPRQNEELKLSKLAMS